MKNLVLLTLAAVIIILSGCTSDTQLLQEYKASIDIAKYQADAAQNQNPTFKGKCSGPCNFEYTDPRDRQRVTGMDVMSNNEAWVNAAPEIKSILSYGIMGYTAYKVLKGTNSGDGNTTTNNSNLVNTDGDVSITNDNGFAGPIETSNTAVSFSEAVDSHDVSGSYNPYTSDRHDVFNGVTESYNPVQALP